MEAILKLEGFTHVTSRGTQVPLKVDRLHGESSSLRTSCVLEIHHTLSFFKDASHSKIEAVLNVGVWVHFSSCVRET